MSGQPYLTFDDTVRPAEQCLKIRTASNSVRKLAETVRVVRLPDPALAQIIKLRGQGYGWEDICVLMQREGLLVSKYDVRRFVLGPQCTTAARSRGLRAAVKGMRTQN
jgi:hypothetical protein